MNDLELLLSLLLTKNPAKPVILHIDGDNPEDTKAKVEKFREDMKEKLKASAVTLTPGQTVTLEERPSETVTIPVGDFRRLVTVAAKYDTLERSYHRSKYGIDGDTAKAVFGPSRYKEDKDDA